ncbi:hypothetical protein [Yoonia sp.]|uniref:hypothetical protein n=1 Tax=Yoonia sp. TaxID=2212373 RepID=UPI002FDA5A1A
MGVIDPDRRYLVVRAYAGFNDMLVQMEHCFAYAEAHGRDIILDTSHSGIKMQFDALFLMPEVSGIKVHIWTEAIGAELDALDSVYPPVARHKMSSIRGAWNSKLLAKCDAETGALLCFDFERDYRAQVLFFAQAGGGIISFRALRRMRLRPEIAQQIVARLKPLGVGYDAIHIRHTDYRSPYIRFLISLWPFVHGRKVLICSDNAAVKAAARLILPRSATVLSISDIPDLGGKPLHGPAHGDAFSANLDMLSDLFALALSDMLFLTLAKGASRRKPYWSGFSVLAFMLQQDRELVRQLLETAGEEATGLFQTVDQGPQGRLRRLQIWCQTRFNKRVFGIRERVADVIAPGPFTVQPRRLPVDPSMLPADETGSGNR